jgi:hypothetical protein
MPIIEAQCHICSVDVSTHDDAGMQALEYCGGCGRPTCAEHREDTTAALCTSCQKPTKPATVEVLIELIDALERTTNLALGSYQVLQLRKPTPQEIKAWNEAAAKAFLSIGEGLRVMKGDR